jgi:AcrR family transcriptional regulator
MSGSRAYRQVARAAATETTRARILDAFAAALRERWMDDVTLDDIAAAASTTRQTVIRLFGGKEGLLAAVAERIAREVEVRRTLPVGGDRPTNAARALARDYEAADAMILRLLAQEEAHPVLSSLLNVGRREHRRWVAETFDEELRRLEPQVAAAVLDQLVVATDVYTWKLLRRDMGHKPATVIQRLASLICAILEQGDRIDG